MANVIFKQGTSLQFQQLSAKDSNTLYWLTDTQELYKGDVLYAKGTEATSIASGLMSAADKAKLDKLSEGAVAGLTAVDGTIVVNDGVDGKELKVGVSAEQDNAIEVKEDGLFVSKTTAPKYEIEKKDEGTDGYAAVYRLKCTDGESVTYPGVEINLPAGLLIKDGSGELKTVESPNQPYEGAEVGDPYLDIELSDTSGTHIYIPVKGLVNFTEAGDGIEMNGSTMSVKLDDSNANGLAVGADGLSLAVATDSTPGAMSAEDKANLDSVMESIVWGTLGD